MRNWLKAAVKRAADDGVIFSVPVTPHTFRHSYIMHMLYHRQPPKVIQALAGHRDARSMEVYTRVFALELAATLQVPFTGDDAGAAGLKCHTCSSSNLHKREEIPELLRPLHHE